MRRSLRWTLTKCRAHDVYRPGERPDVEALVDGEWRRGELRAPAPQKQHVVPRLSPSHGQTRRHPLTG